MTPSQKKLRQIEKYAELIKALTDEVALVVPHPSYYTPTEFKMAQIISMQQEQFILFQQACDEAYKELESVETQTET